MSGRPAWSLAARLAHLSHLCFVNRQEAVLAWMLLLSGRRGVLLKARGRAARGAEGRYLGLVTAADAGVGPVAVAGLAAGGSRVRPTF